MAEAIEEARQSLRKLGIGIKTKWLQELARFLGGDISGQQLSRKAFEHFLNCDLNAAGSGILPTNVSDAHKQVCSLFAWYLLTVSTQVLEGQHVLQVDEVVNVAERTGIAAIAVVIC
jgi:hypothetical protein